MLRLNRLFLLGVTCIVLGVIGVRVTWHEPAVVAPAAHPSTTPWSEMTVELLPPLSSHVPATPQTPRLRGETKPALRPQDLALAQRLRLRGTVLGQRPLAYIEDTALHTTRRYALQEIVGGARLEEIHRGSARLGLPDGGQTVLLLEATADAPLMATSSSRVAADPLAAKAKFSLHVRPSLNAHTNTFEGLAVEALEPEGLARRLGIQPGDVLRTVNGQPLLTPAQSLQVLKKAWRQPELSLELQRDQEMLLRTFKQR